MRPDFLRRSTPTPFTADVRLMARTVRLNTNSAMLLEYTSSALEKYGGIASSACNFLWRFVVESGCSREEPWPGTAVFSNGGLSFANLGQRTFMAVDLEACEAVSFLDESFAKDEMAYERLFLATLVTLTAPALGLTPVSATCVAREGRGLLIFAQPRQGKTLLGYLARRQGLDFHADDLVFLEPDLRIWGGFWPTVFHEDASRALPELLEIARPFSSQAGAYLYLRTAAAVNSESHPVEPVSCVFVEWKKGTRIRMARLNQSELEFQLRAAGFDRERGQGASQAKVSEGLRRLPAHHLTYGADPAEAARLFSELLSRGS